MKRIFLFLLKSILALLVVGAIVYFMGPKPTQPTLSQPSFQRAADLESLEKEVIAYEAAEPGIKPDCEATIVWADSSKKAKTRIAFVYLHGFGASHEEGAPIPRHLADSLGMNLYLARLSEHGVEEGEQNLCQLTADSYYQSAERALHIAKQLGDSVVILATSGGGALGIFLCSRHPEIKAIVSWSPAVALASPVAKILSGPWGIQIARMIRSGNHNDWPFRKPIMAKYWTNHQCWEGIIQFSVFLETTMIPSTFSQIKCPVFVGSYYETEEKQDRSVSVAAMKKMISQLGTPLAQRRYVNFPKACDHIIGCQIVSGDYQGVERESFAFLREICGI